MNEYSIELELLLNESDEAFTRCDVDIYFTYSRGSRSFFDKIFGNWVPGDELNISLDHYTIFPENNTKYDLATVKKLNPKLEEEILEAIQSLEEADLMYDER